LGDLRNSVDEEEDALRVSHDNEEEYYARTIGELQ